MTSFQAACVKEWRLHRSVALDSVIAAVLGCLLLPLDGGIGVLVLGGLAAVRIGTRLGADLSGVDTWEFLLTRPIDRRAYVRDRMRLGLIPVVTVCFLVVLLDAVDAHAWFAHRFVDAAPWADTPAAPTGARTLFAIPVVFLLFVTGFERGLARGGTDQAHSAAFEAAIVGLFVAGAVTVLTTMVAFLLMPAFADEIVDEQGITIVRIDTWSPAVAIVLILAAAAFTWRRCELAVHRKEIVAESRAIRASAATWVVVGLFVVAGLMALLYVGGPVAVAPGGK